MGRWQLSKGQWLLLVLISGRKLPFLPFFWSQIIQFLPVGPWCLSSCCLSPETQSEWVHQKVNPCGPFKRMGTSRSCQSYSATIPAGFQGRSYGYFSSWHQNPGLGHLILQGDLCNWDISPDFQPATCVCACAWVCRGVHVCARVWHQSIPYLCPSYQSQCGFFCIPLVTGLLFRQTAGGSQWWLFCHLV